MQKLQKTQNEGGAMQQLVGRHKRQREHVGAFIDAQQREQLYELARREESSASAILRRALRAELERTQQVQR